MFFFIKYIYINKDAMAAIVNFTMAAKVTKLQMCPVHLFTSKIYVYTLKHVYIILD